MSNDAYEWWRSETGGVKHAVRSGYTDGRVVPLCGTRVKYGANKNLATCARCLDLALRGSGD